VNALDVLDIPLPPCQGCGLDASDIGEFFANFLVEAITDPGMAWVADDWIWHIYAALAANEDPLGAPWIKGTFDDDGSFDDLSYEEMLKADALLKGAIRARFRLELP
jgi:hypothetical protein